LEPRVTVDTLSEQAIPIVIPMQKGTFNRPHGWWPTIVLSDFIFLRDNEAGKPKTSLGEPLDGFIRNARSASRKLGVMTFSSMPVKRKNVLMAVVKMLEEGSFPFSLIYVGKNTGDDLGDLDDRADDLKKQDKFIEVERADFGVLFKSMDFFIIHGGLGTTVEAMRMHKPCLVTGPLVLDQRFWGNVVREKGIGPQEVHISFLHKTCVDFVDGALDPQDPEGWQANARSLQMGTEGSDGVKANVDCFLRLIATHEERIKMWLQKGQRDLEDESESEGNCF